MKVFERYKRCEYSYPEEMEKILAYLNEAGKLYVKGKTIEGLWYQWSDVKWDAGWIMATDENIEAFAEWLEELEF